MTSDWEALGRSATAHGIRIGAVNPNLFQDDVYRFGSLAHRDLAVRRQATQHVRDCIHLVQAAGSPLLSLWLADGTNYPGQDDLRGRRQHLLASLQDIYAALPAGICCREL